MTNQYSPKIKNLYSPFSGSTIVMFKSEWSVGLVFLAGVALLINITLNDVSLITFGFMRNLITLAMLGKATLSLVSLIKAHRHQKRFTTSRTIEILIEQLFTLMVIANLVVTS